VNWKKQSILQNFFLSDGHNQYELSEMSAGERAIFPILMDFARYNINNSIIIIDEIVANMFNESENQIIRLK
jgi:archaellum biogenesis ATPase FlaH